MIMPLITPVTSPNSVRRWFLAALVGKLGGPYGVLTGICIMWFIVAASYRIWLPGLYFDEVLFVNAARGGEDGSFVSLRVANIPVQVMPYLGALKAWLYAPIFHWLGVSPATIRMPAILLAAGTLFIWWLALRKLLTPVPCSMFIILAATDAGLMIQSRLDWGPTVIMGFLKALLFYVFACFIRGPSRWHLPVAIAITVLGFFDKFNFIWIPVAALVALSVAFGGLIFHRLKETRMRRVDFLVLVCFGLLSAGLIKLIGPMLDFPSPHLIHDRIPVLYRGLVESMSGAAVARLIFRDSEFPVSWWSFQLPATAIIALSAIVYGFVWKKKNQAEDRVLPDILLFILIFSSALFIELSNTPKAGGPHHFMVFFPAAYLCLAMSLGIFSAAPSLRAFRLPLSGCILALAAVILFSNLRTTLNFLWRFTEKSTVYSQLWSPGIYDFSAFVTAVGRDYDTIRCADWGIYNNVRSLAPREIRERMSNLDYWPGFTDFMNSAERRNINTASFLIPPGRHLVLLHTEAATVFLAARRGFFEACHILDVEPALLSLPNCPGIEGFEAWSVSRNIPTSELQ